MLLANAELKMEQIQHLISCSFILLLFTFSPPQFFYKIKKHSHFFQCYSDIKDNSQERQRGAEVDVFTRYCLTNARKIRKNREEQYKRPVSQQRDSLIRDSYSNTVLGKYISIITESNNGYLIAYLVGLFRGTALTSLVVFE